MPDPAIVYTLAGRASVHAKTAQAYLEGRPIRGQLLRSRLTRAAEELGLSQPAKQPNQPKTAA
jgi:hypothetical protein